MHDSLGNMYKGRKKGNISSRETSSEDKLEINVIGMQDS